MIWKFISEDDNDYQLEKTTKRNIFTRLRVVVLFSFFLLLIFLLIKNDYSLAFDKREQLELICGPRNTLDTSVDDLEARQEKIQLAIQANQKNFSSLNGFQKIYATQEPIGYQGRKVWMAKAVFSEENPQHKKIPDQLCGFQLVVLYK